MFSTLLLAALAYCAEPLDPAARRELEQVAMTLRYIAGEYGIAVKGHRIANPAEYKEMREFAALARSRAAAATRGHPAGPALAAELAGLELMVAARDPVARVGARIESALGILREGLGVRLVSAPASPPDPVEGERVYRENCAVCHGVSGNGRGPAAAKLDPPPADFSDPALMSLETPLDFFNVANIGVAGTAMPAWHGVLSERELWSAVHWIWRYHADTEERSRGRALLRRRRADLALPDPARAVAATDSELAAALAGGLPDAERSAVVAALRAEPAVLFAARGAASAAGAREEALNGARVDLARARERYAAGDREGAMQAAVGAYLDGFERVEKDLANADAALVREVEERFARLREAMQAGRPASDVAAHVAAIEASLELAGRAASAGLSRAAVFGQSLVIILREGFEVIIVLAALATYLIRIGQRARTAWLYGGAGAAVVASLLLAWLARWAITLTPASSEALEGATMLLAAAVLFWISHWILSRSQVEKWNRYISQTASRAIKAGSLWTLGGVGFLVVFREGVETVLFYQSLSFGAGGAGDAIWMGFGVGCIGLLLLSIAMYQLGLRLPLRPFFVGTSALLYLLAFTFVGTGLHELQAGGYLSVTGWRWLPSLPALGIHPTFESLLPQVLVAAIGLAGLRAIRRSGRGAVAMNGTVATVPPQEQLMALQGLAARLRERAEAQPDEELRNLARQIEAASRAQGPK